MSNPSTATLMQLDREFSRRVGIGLAVLALLAVVAYVAVAFVASIVFAVFLYYAVRPIFRFLERFHLPRQARAWLSLVLFGVPFLVLIGYAVAVVAIEVRNFLEDRGLLGDATDRIADELNIAQFNLDELETLVTDTDSVPPVETVVDSLAGATSAVGGAFFQLVIIVALTYYMLVDGPQLVAWFLDTYDDSGVLHEYVRVVDPELSQTLFGNIVNVFVTGIVAIATFYGFNLLVPGTVEIPFPALAGALVGVGSLIPVVGIKLVYVPITGALAANAWVAGEPELLVPIAGLFVVSAVLLDFIPDIVVRAQFSGDRTHSGLLMVAYIVGPALFGFYGLFLAPMLLIAAINAITILLPYVLSGEPRATEQTTLSEFEDSTTDDD
jgi:predicted PurR-regulated permease PerM